MAGIIARIVRQAARVVSRYRDYPVMTEKEEAFSLHSAQLYVGNVETRDGDIRQGLCFELPRQGWSLKRAVILNRDDAVRLVEFLSHLEARNLPRSFTMSRGGRVLEWEVCRSREEWHGGEVLSAICGAPGVSARLTRPKSS